MHNDQKLSVAIHYNMAFCGGLLGAYALFSRQLVFGSAQTANLMELVSAVCGRNFAEVLIRIGALALYGAAVALSAVLAKKTSVNLKYLTIFLEFPAIFISAFIPSSVDPVIALYPLFFVTAFQWCSFKGVEDFSSSTIFSTNNYKQTVLGFTEYCLASDPEKKKYQKRKACFFGGTLLSFHTAVAIEYLALQAFSLRAIWLCSLPLMSGLILCTAEARRALPDTLKKESVFVSADHESLLNQRETVH